MTLAADRAFGFALSGPLPASPGGEPWQVITIGYALGNLQSGELGSPTFYQDIAGPHNIGEEYRRNTPFIYYAYDANFFGFFGLAGATNCDAAYGVFNSLTNVSTYSAALNEFPPNSQSLNDAASALYLTDLKSTTMHLIVEQLGLIQPERFTWTLHDRFVPPGCPLTTTYLVVQRNFDVLDTPLNQLQYSPYVNDVLYSYYITELCAALPAIPTRAVTHPFSVDPTAWKYSSVAANDYNIFSNPYNMPIGNFGLNIGGFYTGLTKDDVAGLRYLLNSNNINFEATAPSGALLLRTNVQTPVNITSIPFSVLFSQSATNDPDTLRTNYPGISILSVVTNIAPLIVTNITAYFTNLAGPYTNRVPLSNNVAVYPTHGTTVPFTNWSPVQFGDPPILINTQPLAQLLYFSQFLDPATLQSIYPNLITDRIITNYIAIDIQTNIDLYYTNQSVLPTFYRLTNGLPYVTTLTNIYFFTNQPGPTVINYDFSQPFDTISTLDLALFSDRSATNDAATMVALYPGLVIADSTSQPSQNFVTNITYISYLTNYTGTPYQGPPTLITKAVSTNYAFATNWMHSFVNVFTNHVFTNRPYRITSVWRTNTPYAPYGSPFISVTNTKILSTNRISGDFFLVPTNWCGFDLRLTTPLGNPAHTFSATNIIGFGGYTNLSLGNNAYTLTNFYYSQFTNYNYAVYPGICRPVLQYSTNYSTNAIYKYQYNFVNVVTNHYYSNAMISVFITNIYAIPGNAFNKLGTNIVVTNYFTNLPSGDFYLIPSNWCGYQIISLLTNLIVPTNIVLTNRTFGSGTGSGTVTNIQYTEIQYLTYTNYSYSIRPGFCEPALAFTTNYTTNLVTQYQYFFGNLVTNRYYTNAFNRVVTTNLAILTNGLVGQLTNIVTTNFVPAGIEGDFLPIPPAWCDYTRLATQSIGVIFTTNIFTATNASGIDLGQQYTQISVHPFTNMTVLVQPSICDTVAAPPALRQGIERVRFVRANFDSLVGQFFQPITNNYTMVMITNSQMKTEFYQRIITRPDILMTAADLANGPAGINFDLPVQRTIGFDTSQILSGLRGPGTIVAPSTFTFSKVGSIFNNGPFLDDNSYLSSTVNELTQSKALQWASFDSSTNLPILYPNGSSIQNLANMIFIQILPATLPDGNVGVAYNSGAGVTLTGSGGQPPYVWAAANVPALVPGMSFNPATQTLSGTPTSLGVFHFTVQVTDSVNRVVNIDYSITIK